MPDPGDAQPRLDAVPLFPLPNVVLLPRAILPLHIFEPRYRAMTADALDGDRTIAMALLRPGWEKDYYAKPAIEPIVCVGQILSHEQLPDGKYNFLLQGTLRARIVREHGDRPYRLAELEPLPQKRVLEIDLDRHRQRLVRILSTPPFSATGVGRQFLQMLSSPISTSEIADLLAFNLLDDAAVKQSLLADGDALSRVGRVIDLLEAVHRSAPKGRPRDTSLN